MCYVRMFFILGFVNLSIGFSGELPLSAGGKIIQQASYSSASVSYSQAIIASDENTVPLLDAGTTWGTFQVTPLNSSSTLLIQGTLYVSSDPNLSQLAIFDGISNEAVATFYNLKGNVYDFAFIYKPKNTDPINFTIQYGAIAASGPALTVINGEPLGTDPAMIAPWGGGKCYSTVTVYEIGPMDPSPYVVGQYAQGGVVFWVDPSGYHGLVAAIEDQDGGSGVCWYNGLNLYTNAFADGIFIGRRNTETIEEIQGEGNYAAYCAANYSVSVGGLEYADWYLPSTSEINLMFQAENLINATAVQNGGTAFAKAVYWASNENSLEFAWSQDFNNGYTGCADKSQLCRVRAIRAF